MASFSSSFQSPGLNASRFGGKTWRVLPPPSKLPREGATPGGGRMAVHDHSILESSMVALGGAMAEHEASRHETTGLSSTRRGAMAAPRTHSSGSNLRASQSSFLDDAPTRQERAAAIIIAKHERNAELAAMDHKILREKIDKRKDWRDARFKRLLESVSGEDNLAYRTAMDLRDRDEREALRKQQRHEEWNAKIGNVIAEQCFKHMNPPDRAAYQKLAGKKNVQWTMPGYKPRLTVNLHDDPNHKDVVQHAQEHAFHHIADSMLGRSQSAPTIQTLGATRAGFLPMAVSRSVLEPTEWSQQKFQGTLFGLNAQVAEFGPGFHRGRRGGSDVHLLDESDGVPCAGTRIHARTGSYYDKGILAGAKAANGESSEHRTLHGASSGAPTQDHFLYESGFHVTNQEFPKGRKTFPEQV